MKKINLTKATVKTLSEIFQSLDIKFAWVNHKYEEVSTPAKCRDFLGDCIYSKESGDSVNIYDFKYNWKGTPFDDCRFSLKFPDKASYNNLINNLHYLHKREKKAGVKLTKVFTTDDKSTLVVEGSNYWTRSIWKISLYTYYLKLISFSDPTKPGKPESDYAAELTPEKEDKLLAGIRKNIKTKPSNYYEAHNYHGFVSILRGYSQVRNTSNKLGVV